MTRGRRQSRTRGCSFTSRMDPLEGPEQRHAGTKPKIQMSPLATVGEGPGGEGWQPGTQRGHCRVSSPGRQWRRGQMLGISGAELAVFLMGGASV